MPERRDVAVLIGSLRQQAYSRKLAMAMIQLAPPALGLRVVELGELSLFNQDLEAQPPAPWVQFRQQIAAADAVLFVTPEYNRSVPAVLKNAVDIASRPRGQSVWSGKPGAVISISPGMMGGFGANHHLRQSLTAVNVATMSQPEVYLSGADKIFDEQGALASDATRDVLLKFLRAFEQWIAYRAAPKS